MRYTLQGHAYESGRRVNIPRMTFPSMTDLLNYLNARASNSTSINAVITPATH